MPENPTCLRCGSTDECLPAATTLDLVDCPCTISGTLCGECRVSLDSLIREFWAVRAGSMKVA